MKFWLSRDENGPYNLTKRKKDHVRKVYENEVPGVGVYFDVPDDSDGMFEEFCVDRWEAVTRFRLKPGEGPVRVNLEVTRA